MVVDLERNDLGRVCVPGSVRVEPLGAIETTSYCHQMVSSVRGLLRLDASVGEALCALFPCGSVTGAPKLAAMRIAGQLERGERGIYTGSLIVAMPGHIDSSVLIRTVELDGDEVRYGTGCGITIDSDPAEEWRESELKTHPLLGVR
jgi:anthranilate synthase component I